MCLDMLFFLEVLATVVALFWQTGKGGEWQVIWCLRRPQIIHDVGSLCISTMWLLTSFWWGKNVKAAAVGEGDKWPKGPRGI